VLGGLELQHDLVDCGAQTLDTTTGMLADPTCRFPDGSTMTQLGLYAEARRDFLEDRLGVRAGLRGGVSALRISDIDPTDDADASAEVTTTDWAAELGVEWRATEELSLLANLGRGFRAPNIGDLSGLGPRPGNRYQQPADSLANERALGADLGIRLRHARLTGEAYVFALRHDDRIDVVPTGEMTGSGRQIVVSANVGTTSTHGVEVAGVLQVVTDLQLSGALTWLRGTKNDLGERKEPADRIPPAGGSLTARWLPIPALELETSLRFAAAQRRLSARDEEDPRIDPTGTDRFFLFSIGASYAWPSVRIAARVENLADRQYREHASGVDAPGIDARLLVTWRNTY
jgi:outer membrane receptor protein involved in Fe transport